MAEVETPKRFKFAAAVMLPPIERPVAEPAVAAPAVMAPVLELMVPLVLSIEMFAPVIVALEPVTMVAPVD
ncbi:MAG: hypothetical protein KAY21_00920 [Limnohabitans sp.]|nr:hypothetical protein [Limnohabitans sp.]